jgi:hypothetical protein
VANGVYQNTVFGMAAKLPFKYTGAVILGTVSIKDTKIREFLLLGDQIKEVESGKTFSTYDGYEK